LDNDLLGRELRKNVQACRRKTVSTDQQYQCSNRNHNTVITDGKSYEAGEHGWP